MFNFVRVEQVERIERVEQVERVEHFERIERIERVEHVEHLERVEHLEHSPQFFPPAVVESSFWMVRWVFFTLLFNFPNRYRKPTFMAR